MGVGGVARPAPRARGFNPAAQASSSHTLHPPPPLRPPLHRRLGGQDTIVGEEHVVAYEESVTATGAKQVTAVTEKGTR